MGNPKIELCIIPAAGKGSRWAPVSGYLPKEMLPLIDRPVLEWVIKEALDSGIKRIVIVLNKQKRIIKEYLLSQKNLSKKCEFIFINQEKALGIADALWLCKGIIKDQPFSMALPDLPTISKKPVLKQLIETSNKNPSSHIISFSSFPTDTLSHYTECLLEQKQSNFLKIIHFCPKKDSRSHHPGSKIRMSGRYILQPTLLPIIEKLFKENKEIEIKEVEPLITALERGEDLIGLNIQGHTYDTGNPTSYIRANTAFFKKRLQKIS